MELEEETQLTEELNWIYRQEDSHLDPVIQQLMLVFIPFENWDEAADKSLDLFKLDHLARSPGQWICPNGL